MMSRKNRIRQESPIVLTDQASQQVSNVVRGVINTIDDMLKNYPENHIFDRSMIRDALVIELVERLEDELHRR